MPYKDPERKRQFSREWMKRRRQEWFAANGPCKACGSSENLEMDYTGSGKANHRLWSFSEARRTLLLRDYRVLCHLCRTGQAPAVKKARQSLPSLSEIKTSLLNAVAGLRENDKSFRPALFLLVAAMREDIGQNSAKLANFIGVSKDIAQEWKNNLVKNGIWRNGKWGFSSALGTPQFEVEFWMHALVAEGTVCVVNPEPGVPPAKKRNRKKHDALKSRKLGAAPRPPKAQPSAPKPRIKWCIDCYVTDHLHTRASTEVDSDPLCEVCVQRRTRQAIAEAAEAV